jgi:iron complex transport system substrate-binding protein
LIAMRNLLLAAALVLAGTASAFAEPPKRIAIAGNGLTEIVYALGGGDRVVAVDTTSLYPKRVAELPKIGYLRALGAEGILSLRPDLLLVSEDAGPPPVLAQLTGAGLRVVKAREGHSAEILAERVRMVGSILERGDAAGDLERGLATDFAALAKSLAASPTRPRVVFVLSAGGGAPLAAGAETSAEAIFKLAGATNAIDGYKGYKPLSAEALAGSGAETIVTVTHTLQALGGEAAMRALPQFTGAKDMRIVAFDADYLLGFGPRTAHAARDLAAALRPRETIAALPPRAWTAAP